MIGKTLKRRVRDDECQHRRHANNPKCPTLTLAQFEESQSLAWASAAHLLVSEDVILAGV